VSQTRVSIELLRFAAAMADPKDRPAAARSLAGQLGWRDAIVFVRDQGVGQSLPAPGFPQTLRDAAAWLALVERAITSGQSEGEVTAPDGTPQRAHAIGLPDGTATVFFGGDGGSSDLEIAEVLLPLFGALFRAESAASRARAEATLARQSAAQAVELTAKLDMTRAELQRALGVAETATRARDEFLATVSHELRTPLTSILGWVQLLRNESDPMILGEALDTIDRNARAQSRLIEDILDFSRINAGKLRLDVRPVDLIDVIGAALDVVRPGAEGRGIRIDSVLDPNAGFVSGDPDRLQQVAWNLLSNAVKFTQRGGRVQVRLERINSHAELTVSDNGQGISPDFLPYVFDRFSQADTSSTRVHAGLGLGLGIVRHLVELHGGTVQAFSPGEGKGATFAVRLPLMVAHDPVKQGRWREEGKYDAESERADRLADLSGLSVLVVEDNDDARKLLTAILERAGAVVQSAPGAEAALTMLNSLHPDILISDIEMPGEDGYSLIRKIRLQESPVRAVPAIALTAYARSIDRVRALAAGFQMHMSKPVEPLELTAAVRSLSGPLSRLP
jgi:signal transduction histidine kinase/CheY-like chemotaxis protein